MTMREKIARAIDPLAWTLEAFDLNAADLADYQEHHRPRSLASADDVLSAMRELTPAMEDAFYDCDDGKGGPSNSATKVWVAMIDAAVG